MTFESNPDVQAFVKEVTEALLDGKRHQIPGFGAFSTCTRKATADRAACTIAMFRASKELREHAASGPAPAIDGAHAEVVTRIIDAMTGDSGIDVPGLGHLAVVKSAGKMPRLIFHGSDQLNSALTGTGSDRGM